MKSKEQRTFEKNILYSSTFPIFFGMIVTYLYSANFVGATYKDMLSISFFLAIIWGVSQFILGPLVNHIICMKNSANIDLWKKGKADNAFRTKLLESTLRIPIVKAIEVFCFFFISTGIMALIYRHFGYENLFSNIISAIACIFGSYLTAILVYSSTGKVCSEVCQKIVSDGINTDIVYEKNYFGFSVNVQFVLLLVIPAVYTSALAFLVVFVSFLQKDMYGIFYIQMRRMIFVTIANISVMSILAVYFFRRIYSYSNQMQKALNDMNTSDVCSAVLVPTDLENEISYTIFLIDRAILLYRSIIERAEGIGHKILVSTRNLVDTSTNISATAQQQAASAKEITATMKDANDRSFDIEKNISEVSKVAGKTKNDVEIGSKTLAINTNKMEEITAANQKTREGIKQLNIKISGIWDIANLITSVADQTKIIAFNAELEASSVEDEGRKNKNVTDTGRDFKNVADEVRHLADRTVDATSDIKDRIAEIRKSLESLIETSQTGTEKIEKGGILSKKLEERFNAIRESAENTASSSEEIKEIIEQQVASFQQIVATVKQIATGVETFSKSTLSITNTSKNLNSIANRLDKINGDKADASV